MIDIITYTDDFKMAVFNEPYEDYYHIMLQAASDNHRLSLNYKTNLIHQHLFMCLLYYKENPAVLFGLYQDSDLPSNVARCFNRYYSTPEWRSLPSLRYSGAKKHGRQLCLSFYNTYPSYHRAYGIDTLFFTRNVLGTSSDRFLTQAMQQLNFTKMDTPRSYKETLQWFWVQGDASFTTRLP